MRNDHRETKPHGRGKTEVQETFDLLVVEPGLDMLILRLVKADAAKRGVSAPNLAQTSLPVHRFVKEAPRKVKGCSLCCASSAIRSPLPMA